MAQTELARREQGCVEVRAEPARVRWEFQDLVAADGHALCAVLACSVRALPAEAERRMLEEVFLGNGQIVTTEAVVDHFRPSLHAAAVAAARNKSAAEWLDDDRGELVEALKAAGKRVAFSCGLELLPPFELNLESPSLERQRLEAMQRSLAEQRAAGQLEHFQRAGELLKQFEAIRQSAPQLSPSEVLRQLGPADQGMMLQTLLLAAGKQKATSAVWAVAGMNLLRIDPRRSPLKAEMIPLPTELGPLRSVQPCDDGLLVGARLGVMLVTNIGQTPVCECYGDLGLTSQLGFSRVVKWHDEIWACHGEAGVVAWKSEQKDKPALALRPGDLAGASPRNLQALDDARLVFSTHDRLMVLERGATAAKAAGPATGVEIVALLPEPRQVTVVLKDGRVQARDRQTLEILREERPSGPVSSAALLPWLGSARLLLATEDGPVICMSWEDDVVTQYVSVYRGMRAIAAAADVIVALNDDRQRVVVWNTWNARQPLGDVFVTALTKHRAADIDV